MIIDISHNQGQIDFNKLKNVGNVDSVFIKVTEGSTYVDPMFIKNALAAQSAGLKIGFYHFASLNTTDVIADAKAEANFFVTNMKRVSHPTLSVVLDLEVNKAGVHPLEVQTWITTFFATLASNGYTDIMIYSYSWFFNANLPANHPFGSIKLWLADYNAPYTIPHGWSKVYLWQYSNRGHVAGIITTVDLNKYV